MVLQTCGGRVLETWVAGSKFKLCGTYEKVALATFASSRMHVASDEKDAERWWDDLDSGTPSSHPSRPHGWRSWGSNSNAVESDSSVCDTIVLQVDGAYAADSIVAIDPLVYANGYELFRYIYQRHIASSHPPLVPCIIVSFRKLLWRLGGEAALVPEPDGSMEVKLAGLSLELTLGLFESLSPAGPSVTKVVAAVCGGEDIEAASPSQTLGHNPTPHE